MSRPACLAAAIAVVVAGAMTSGAAAADGTVKIGLVIAMTGEQAFEAGVTEERALSVVLPHLTPTRTAQLADECIAIYIDDRSGGRN